MKQFSASKVTKILKEFFPERQINYPPLNLYKKNGLVVPTGNILFKGRRSYTEDDIVLLVWYIQMKEHRIADRHLKPALAAIRRALKVNSITRYSYVTGCKDNADVYNPLKNTPVFKGCDFYWTSPVGLVPERVKEGLMELGYE